MGKKKDLNIKENQKFVSSLAKGESTLEISKMLQRDHRTVKAAVKDVTKKRRRTKGRGFRNVTATDTRKLKQIVMKEPLLSSSEVFDKAGVTDVKWDKRR